MSEILIEAKPTRGTAVRTSVAAADTGDVSALYASGVNVAGSMHVRLSLNFNANTDSALICLALFDQANALIGITAKEPFVPDSALTDGTNYLSAVQIFDTMGAAIVYPIITGLTGTVKNLYVRVMN